MHCNKFVYFWGTKNFDYIFENLIKNCYLYLFIPKKCGSSLRGLRRQKLKIWLRYTSLIFLNFQNQKSFWKSDDQKYAFGGGAKGRTYKSSLSVYMHYGNHLNYVKKGFFTLLVYFSSKHFYPRHFSLYFLDNLWIKLENRSELLC